ncbi:ArgR family transcriptional regulator [Prolixibacteraceae bacterium JC049]|nr:ArgR family transcriptional regulator [Prolixibacteraceae bacterium JC049]
MKNRTKRLIAIKNVITTNKVGSQEELLTLLKTEGFELGQATLSRDLKFLKVAKVADPDKGYIYVVPEGVNAETVAAGNPKVNYLADGFESLNFSGNLAVIKTLPGYASSIAVVIDSAKPMEIIGSIAGDDTILLVMREEVSRNDLISALILIMPKLEEKLE